MSWNGASTGQWVDVDGMSLFRLGGLRIGRDGPLIRTCGSGSGSG